MANKRSTQSSRRSRIAKLLRVRLGPNGTVCRMRPQEVGEPVGDVDHHVGSAALKSIDPLRKIEWFDYGPDLLMLVRRQNVSRITCCDPANRNDGAGLQPGSQVHNGVHADLRFFAKVSAVENCGSGGDENLILQYGSYDMGVWADQAMISNSARMTLSGTNDGILHHDTLSANCDCTSVLADNARPVHDTSPGTYDDVAAHRGIWCYPGRRVNLRMSARVSYQHC